MKNGFDACTSHIKKLLDDCEKLVNNGGSMSTALGIYTLAVEEYGKALLLKNAEAPNIESDIFSKHERKFEEALNSLPAECKDLPIGFEVREASRRTRTVSSKGGAKVSVPSFLTGKFYDMVLSKPNFDVRKECFYVDWDNSSKQWKLPLTVEKNSLLRAIQKMRDEVRTQLR